jgi:hypothetical protein
MAAAPSIIIKVKVPENVNAAFKKGYHFDIQILFKDGFYNLMSEPRVTQSKVEIVYRNPNKLTSTKGNPQDYKLCYTNGCRCFNFQLNQYSCSLFEGEVQRMAIKTAGTLWDKFIQKLIDATELSVAGKVSEKDGSLHLNVSFIEGLQNIIDV